MDDNATPVSIGKRTTEGTGLSQVLGQSAADVIRLHMGVIDREDRLESGTGSWLATFFSDEDVRATAVRESVTRAIHTASDANNFAILSLLSPGIGTPIETIERASGLTRLPLAERLGDLISAGLATKIPEANQVAGTAAGAAMVELVNQAGEQGSRDLIRDRP